MDWSICRHTGRGTRRLGDLISGTCAAGAYWAVRIDPQRKDVRWTHYIVHTLVGHERGRTSDTEAISCELGTDDGSGRKALRMTTAFKLSWDKYRQPPISQLLHYASKL